MGECAQQLLTFPTTCGAIVDETTCVRVDNDDHSPIFHCLDLIIYSHSESTILVQESHDGPPRQRSKEIVIGCKSFYHPLKHFKFVLKNHAAVCVQKLLTARPNTV